MDIPHVVNLLNIANDNLPSVQYRYEQLQIQITTSEEDKRRADRDFQNQIDETVVICNIQFFNYFLVIVMTFMS
jgi:DNA polymerase III alpha subunit